MSQWKLMFQITHKEQSIAVIILTIIIIIT